MGRKKPFVDKKNAATYALVFKSSENGDEVERVFVRTDDGPACVPGFGDEGEERRSRMAGDADSNDGSFAGYWSGSHALEPPLSAEQRQELLDAGFPDDGYNYLRHLRSISEQGTFVSAPVSTLDRLGPDVKVYSAAAETGVKVVTGRGFGDLEEEEDVEALSDGEIEDDFVMIANERGDGAVGSASGEGQVEVSEGDEEGEWDEEAENEYRPDRELDLQFEKLILDEYEDGDEYEDEDGAVPDFELDSAVLEEAIAELTTDRQYETPAGLASLKNRKDEESTEDGGLYGLKGAGARLVPEKYLFEDEESDHEVVLEEVSDEEEQWDCETFVSTFSNLENHPATIDAPVTRKNLQTVLREGENRPTIRLAGKEKLPVDYVGRKSVEKPKNKVKLPAIHEQPPSSNESPSQGENGSKTRGSSEDRKAHKAAVKAERREARVAKKALKLQYKAESKRIQQGVAQAGRVAMHL